MNLNIFLLLFDYIIYNIYRIVASTYQSVSGAGKSAMDELLSQTEDYFQNKEIDSKKTKPSILPNVSEEEQYRYALGRAIQNDYITAEKAFIEFKNLNPDHVRASDSLFWLGRVQFMQGFYEKSAMTISEFNSMYSADPRIPETTLLIAPTISLTLPVTSLVIKF